MNTITMQLTETSSGHYTATATNTKNGAEIVATMDMQPEDGTPYAAILEESAGYSRVIWYFTSARKQEILDTLVEAKRAKEMKTSPQLTLGELIAKLEAIEDKNKPVIFNETYHPIGIDSWRGSYAELAIGYAEAFLPLSVSELLQMLKKTIGATFHGYKGGKFLMGKTTPVWVANYGYSEGFTHEGDIWTQAVIGVSEDEYHVILETKNIEY